MFAKYGAISQSVPRKKAIDFSSSMDYHKRGNLLTEPAQAPRRGGEKENRTMNNEEFGADLVTLVDDEGNEHEFEIVDTLDLNDERYVALVASYENEDEESEDDGELVILKAVVEGEEEFLEAIEDEAEFDEVAALFMERLEDDFDFVGGDEEPQ